MKWFLLLPAWAIFNLFCYLLGNWWFPLFATMQLGPINNNNGTDTEPRLPTWLSYGMTQDNSLWGDAGFKTTHDGGYWSQVAWLYRNTAYGFERSVLAANITPDISLAHNGDPSITDKPNGKTGFCKVWMGSYWSYDLVWQWNATKCFKLSFGWKLKTYAENPDRILTEPVAQYCVTIKPLTDFA